MIGYVKDLSSIAEANPDFRQVLYTAKHSQLVVMSIPPQGEIGEDVHTLDQFFRVESGNGVAVLDGVTTPMRDGFAILIPAGTRHNVLNTGTRDLKLYTVYSPPNHRDGVRHHTRAGADADPEHFEGATTRGAGPEARQG